MNEPSMEDILLYKEYKRLSNELKDLKISTLVEKGYNKAHATNMVEKIDASNSASYGYEQSPLTIQKEKELIKFALSPEFNKIFVLMDELRKRRPSIRGLTRLERVKLAEKNENDFFTWKGPTPENRARKQNTLSELKSLPPFPEIGFPGGENYRTAQNHWPKPRKTRKKTRKHRKN